MVGWMILWQTKVFCRQNPPPGNKWPPGPVLSLAKIPHPGHRLATANCPSMPAVPAKENARASRRRPAGYHPHPILGQKKLSDDIKQTTRGLGETAARQRRFLGHRGSSPPPRPSAPVRGQKLPPQGGGHQVGRKQTQTLWMKKGKLFLTHRYEKAGRMAFYPDSPPRSQPAGDTSKNRFCPKRSLICSICSLRCAPTFMKLLSPEVSPEIFTQERI